MPTMRHVGLCALTVLALVLLAACVPIQPAPASDLGTSTLYPLAHVAPDCEYGGSLKSIEALDALTIKFTTCAPVPDLPTRLTGGQLAINDADTLVATGGGGDLLRQPNGTGPFRLVDWSADDLITMARFDEYWGAPALPTTLTFQWNEDTDVRVAALQADEVDGIRAVDKAGADLLAANGDFQFVALPPFNVSYIGFNNLVPPLDNPLVRQAISMAIDREALVEQFYAPGSLVPTQFLPPQVIGYTDGLSWHLYDPAMARDILAGEGVDALELTLSYLYDSTAEKVVQEIAAQLGEVGISTTILPDTEYEDYFTALVEGQVGELNWIGWNAGVDAGEWYVLFARDAGLEFGEGIPAVWDALDEAATLASAAERQPLYDAVAALLLENSVMLPIMHEATINGFQANVTGNLLTAETARTSFATFQAGDGDTFRWMQGGAPASAYCPDEVDLGSELLCRQISETLVSLDAETLAPGPLLATAWSSNDDFKEWTFTLREGVRFHDGADFAADDVLTSLAAMWDAAHPLHVGNSGAFEAWMWSFGPHLNAPQE